MAPTLLRTRMRNQTISQRCVHKGVGNGGASFCGVRGPPTSIATVIVVFLLCGRMVHSFGQSYKTTPPIRCTTSRAQSKTHAQVNLKNSSAHQSRNSTCSGRDTSHSVALTMCVCCVVCKRETMYVCVSCGLRVSRGVRAFSYLRVSRDVCVKCCPQACVFCLSVSIMM